MFVFDIIEFHSYIVLIFTFAAFDEHTIKVVQG